MIKSFIGSNGKEVLLQLEAIIAVEVRKTKVLVVTNSGFIAHLSKKSGQDLVKCLGDWKDA